MSYSTFAFLRRLREKLSGKGLGKIPFASSLYTHLTQWAQPRGIIQIWCQGNRMFVDARDTGFVPDLLIHGIYEPFETNLVRTLLRPGMCVINVGANIGYYTLIAARAVGLQGAVYAFEPEPNNFQLLQKNIELNGFTNVHTFQIALSNASGSMRLFLDQENIGNPSLSADNISTTQGSVEVTVDTMDSVLKRNNMSSVDLVIMDVQGAEGLVIESATETIRTYSPIIIMEFWPYGIRNIGSDPIKLLGVLQGFGYKIEMIDEHHARTYPVTSPHELLALCQRSKNGKGSRNLILRKT